MNKAKLKRYATEPLAFVNDLIIPSAKGTLPFREVMADHQRQWFQAVAPAMLAFAGGEKPPVGRFWSERTKGGSKDSDIACVLLWLLAFTKRKFDSQVGAADRDQAAELKKAAVDVLRLNPWLNDRVYDQAWTLHCDATESTCTIIAADVAGSHGARPDIVVLNELSHITKEEFAANLLDNASKKPEGLVIVATNAGFLGTWQHSWREMARESERWDFHSFCEPAPWLDDEEIEEAQRRNSTSRFNRLFWGEWVNQSGDALDQEDIDACTDADLTPTGRQPGWFYVAGVDLGIKHDHSAIVVLGGRYDTQELRLAYAESWKPDPRTGKVDLMLVESTILELNRRYNFATVGIDPYQAALLQQRLERQRVRCQEFTFSGGNLTLMASTMLDVFRSHRIKLYPHKALIRDLGRLTIEEKSYGYRLEATSDVDGHADLATALAIALPLAVEKSGCKPPINGVLNLNHPLPGSSYESPFALPHREFERLQAEYQRERERLAGDDGDPGGTHEWKQLMRSLGR